MKVKIHLRLKIILINFFMVLAIYANTALGNEYGVYTAETTRVSGVKNNLSKNKQGINVTGSTTVSNVLNLLADRFEQKYKGIKINISGGGSSSAVAAMLANPEIIGQMSRAMKKKEQKAFIEHYGYKPIEFKIAVDALAVYVNKTNPIIELTKKQLTNIFSARNKNINHWGDLDITSTKSSHWKNQQIKIYTLPKSSGAYSLFNKKILNKKGYKITSISQPTSSSVIQSVGVYPGAITFASSFFKTKRTHFIALEGKDGKFYQPIQPWISSFKYPLSRYLYLYINQKPGTKVSTTTTQFLNFLMAEGTQILIKRAGFYSISKKIRSEQIQLLKNDFK